MAYVFEKIQQSGVLFFFHKCGTTMVHQNIKINNELRYVRNDDHNPSALKPMYYDYKKKHKRHEQAYLLIRNPIERFYSGYWHYWRYWQRDFDGIKHWAQQRLNCHIEKYSMDVHLDLYRSFDKLTWTNNQDYNFLLHCIHDLADEYVPDMKIVKLGTVPQDKFLKKLLTTKVYGAKNDSENNFDYPVLELTKTQRQFINNKYRTAMNLFGYGNDY